MAVSSSQEEAEPLRPPSPKLGNFNDIFDQYMKDVSRSAPRIDVNEIIAHMEAIGKIQLDIKTLNVRVNLDIGHEDVTGGLRDKKGSIISETSTVRTAIDFPDVTLVRKPSPVLVQVTSLPSGSNKDLIPISLYTGAGGDNDATPRASAVRSTPGTGLTISSSSPETSDDMAHSQSVFDQTPWQPSTDATPVTSPDGIRFAQLMQPMESTPTRKGNTPANVINIFHAITQSTTATFDYAAVGISGFQSVNLQASASSMPTTITPASRNAATNHQTLTTLGEAGYDGAYNKITSANGLFRYRPFLIQPYPGAELYTVEVTQSGVDRIIPKYMSTRQDKQRVLEYRLQQLIVQDRAYETAMPSESGRYHVFVDMSNITIGFYDTLKQTRGIPVQRRIRTPKFSFENLAITLERGRNVTKRVVCGSVDKAYKRKWPLYMQEAEDLGYEMAIMQRVAKAVTNTARNKRLSGSLEPEWTASDANSSTDDAFLVELKQGEQGVDELLHLKMLQSLADDRPGTVVLATGDAAEAEFSDGFKANLVRLLNSGWNAEIIGWSATMSKAWTDPEFLAQYEGQVRILVLDPYIEEIFGAWFGAPGC